MKKIRPIFFVFVLFFANMIVVPNETVSAKEEYFNFDFCGNQYSYTSDDFGSKYVGSESEILKKVVELGFSESDAVRYMFKNIDNIIASLKDKTNFEPKMQTIDVFGGEPIIVEGKLGSKLNEEKFLNELFKAFVFKEKQMMLPVEEIEPNKYCDNINDLTNLKSGFTTYINGTNQEGRIENIKRALSAFNGKVVLPNEVVSFNNVIGDTTKENGYSLAKVILNGKYVDDYGGGVCQAATTLYNALLLADMKILQVRPHSLKVGYVMGSFDAMVSNGVSDLVFENTSNYPIFIHTRVSDSECQVKIFGIKNDYQIERRRELVDIDEEKQPNISYKSVGYLDYFKDGVLVESKKIRSDNYYKVKEN